ncbi:hypothetical protein JAAARDRAFT_141611, partial [Jaapia argillacea MUCL 33604]
SKALALLTSLNIPMFGSKLTLFQAAHHLAYTGICQMLTIEDIGLWISKNTKKGVYSSLANMGLLSVSSAVTITTAFRVVYDHLNTYLTKDDQQELGFDVIFVEHTLCKVSRYSKSHSLKFLHLANEEEK